MAEALRADKRRGAASPLTGLGSGTGFSSW